MTLAELLDCPAVGIVEAVGKDDPDFGQQVAGWPVFRVRAMPFHPEFRPAGGAGWNAQGNGSIGGRHINLCPQGRFGKCDRHLHV